MHGLAHIGRRRILLFGILIALLVAIPLTLYILQKGQTQTQSGATQSTTISFDPPTQNATIGSTVKVNVWVDPGSGANANKVSVVTLNMTYDPNLLDIVPQTDPVTNKQTCILNTNVLPTELSTATCGNGTAFVRYGAVSVNNFISSRSKIATIEFKAKSAGTAKVDWNVSDPTNQTNAVSAAASPNNPNPKDKEANVIIPNSLQPATIVIAAAVLTPTVTSVPQPSVTLAPSVTPLPTVTPQPTQPASPSQPAASAPTCNSLAADNTTGNTPLAINFTASGSINSVNSLSSVTFNFGDGSVQDVAIAQPTAAPTQPAATTNTPTPTTESSGGSNITPTGTDNSGSSSQSNSQTVNQVVAGSGTAQASHTYSNPGTYQASAIFTDSAGNKSTVGSCTKTITVNGVVSPTGPTSPSPTIKNTGPGETILGFGVVGVVLTVIGGLLLFVL